MLLLLAIPVLAGCSDDDDKPEAEPSETVSTSAPAYDPSLEPAAAVLPLVPDDANRLAVTDYEQVRLQLGNPDLTDLSDRLRQRYWSQVEAETAALSPGVLRDADAELRSTYRFSQDDVVWEAHFGNEQGATGWVLKFRDDLPMKRVVRAVEAGVGPLEGVKVAVDQHVIGTGTATDTAASWATDEAISALVGGPAVATYAERGCIVFEDLYGEGVLDQLASGPSTDVEDLAELPAYTVAFGGRLATARLGDARGDTFLRSRIADALPETDPDFTGGFTRPVADPSSGRIGYTLADPRVAVDLTLTRQLPFAACGDQA